MRKQYTPKINLANHRYGRLTAVAPVPYARWPSWKCLCDCGQEAIVTQANLRQGDTRSCGCLMKEVASQLSARYATFPVQENAAEYNAWMHMRERCLNPKDKRFHDYGGRGIAVYPEWIDSFEAFRQYVGPRPSSKHSLDRYPDNNGNYEPGNVRWATRREQSRNTRGNRIIEICGRSQAAVDWAEELHVNPSLIYNRLRKGWTPERALFTPIDVRKRNRRYRSNERLAPQP